MYPSFVVIFLLGAGTLALVDGHLGCPLPFGEISGRCIYVENRDYGSWHEMETHCNNLHGHLVKLDDANFLYHIVAYINAHGLTNTNYWIGAHEEGHAGTWRWTDGSSVKMGTPYWSYIRSRYQNPIGEHCALLDRSYFYTFNDFNCEAHVGGICEL